MNKFEQYAKAESVVKSVNSISQMGSMVAYIKLFRRQSNDHELNYEIRRQGLLTIGKIQEKSGLSDLIELRGYFDKI